MKCNSEILQVQVADEHHQVVTVASTGHRYCRRPCPECPWRLDTAGQFPAEAFRISAVTAYDVPDAVLHWRATGIQPGTFSCHVAGAEQPATCAGFLLRGAQHSLAVRLKGIRQEHFDGVTDMGLALHASYRAMAVANGVSPDDPALEKCRAEDHEAGHGESGGPETDQEFPPARPLLRRGEDR